MSGSAGRAFSLIPYNDLDITQGPVMRMLGISTLSIKTEGYSGQNVSEIRIEAIEHAEDLRELIRSLVRQSGMSIDGTGGGAPLITVPTNQKIIEELVKIRLLLEQQKNNDHFLKTIIFSPIVQVESHLSYLFSSGRLHTRHHQR